MLRLRTTSSLSVLALAIGIAGTGWISTLTAGGRSPAPRAATVHHALPSMRIHVVSAPARKHAQQTRRAVPDGSGRAIAAVQAPPIAAPAELLPLATPADDSMPWADLRGHLDGRVVLHVGIDARGRVCAASLADSSGDAVLDEHALRSVRGWRFAVSADHPAGMRADLPMRFTSRDAREASAR
ncbi:MAG TPA: TonB family protein [Rhodanobacter sp.]